MDATPEHEAVVSCRLAYEVDEPATIVLDVAASARRQVLVEESWQVDRDGVEVTELTPDEGGSRRHRVIVEPGPLSIRYEARVALPGAVRARDPGPPPAPGELDHRLLALLRPSRYAQSDRVAGMVAREFGELPAGAAQVRAIADWVHDKVAYHSGSTDAEDSALETVLTRRGVCRDFAHLTIAFARALEIPARYASVYAPLLEPPDFHAVAEVHLGGHWWTVDPTRLAPRPTLVRISTGRDAADVALATILGGRVRGTAVDVAAHTVDDPPTDDHGDLVRAGAA